MRLAGALDDIKEGSREKVARKAASIAGEIRLADERKYWRGDGADTVQ